ncbi:MAG: hypothetical protein NUV53_00135 [Patescibacteria group bacterium]|nr:hypothetical protein [Patescibacteria group bacterium]
MKKFLLVQLNPNGVAGHFWMGIVGLVITVGESFPGFFPDPQSLLVLAGVVIFATLLIPAGGTDRETEADVLIIMTFGTSGVFGATIGAMLTSLEGISPKLLTPSMIWSMTLVILVCKSYWKCGYLSRELLARVFSSVRVNDSVLHLIAFLERHKFHVRVRNLRRAILDFDAEAVAKTFDGWVEGKVRFASLEAILRQEEAWTENIENLFVRAREDILKHITSGGESVSLSSDSKPVSRGRVKIHPAQQ